MNLVLTWTWILIGTNECEYIRRNINSRLPKGVNLTRSVPVYPAYSPVGMQGVEELLLSYRVPDAPVEELLLSYRVPDAPVGELLLSYRVPDARSVVTS